MAHSKKQGQQAFALMTKWREDGVPDLITAFEAYRLTDGKVGFPYSHKRKNSPMRLVDVALKAITKGVK